VARDKKESQENWNQNVNQAFATSSNYVFSCESGGRGMVTVKKEDNPSEVTRALRMVTRANSLKDIILDELYGLQYSGVNISTAQVQEIATKIMRRAHLPTGEAAQKMEGRLRRVAERKFLKRQNGMR
jgi:hypothetical protein